MINSHLGFGLLDAYALVKTAANWTLVDLMHTCNVSTRMLIKMEQLNTLVLFQSTGSRESENEINALEYVQIVVVPYVQIVSIQMSLQNSPGNDCEVCEVG